MRELKAIYDCGFLCSVGSVHDSMGVKHNFQDRPMSKEPRGGAKSDVLAGLRVTLCGHWLSFDSGS